MFKVSNNILNFYVNYFTWSAQKSAKIKTHSNQKVDLDFPFSFILKMFPPLRYWKEKLRKDFQS